MTSPISIIAAITLGLGAVEATAYWWMHPAPAGLNKPVIVYRPGDREELSVVSGPLSEQSRLSPSENSPSSAANRQPLTANPSTTLTPLPEVYDQAAPMLRCSSGQIFHAKLDESLGLHLAFFEWNDTDTGSVLEAFRHMPEACMGSIGMTLVSKEKTIRYQVGSESLVFDHTIFREPGQGGGVAALAPPVHAFRAVWVAGIAGSDARQGIGGDEFDHLRTIRLKSALTRFRPSHARVIQGAVRGAPSGGAAWQAFETAMLKDLTFQ